MIFFYFSMSTLFFGVGVVLKAEAYIIMENIPSGSLCINTVIIPSVRFGGFVINIFFILS